MKSILTAVLLCVFCILFAGAIEISLEENKAESGTVGYVDIEKVFSKYSLTAGEREKFREKVREKQDYIDRGKNKIEELEKEIRKLEKEKRLAGEIIKKSLESEPFEAPSSTAAAAVSSPAKAAAGETTYEEDVIASTGAAGKDFSEDAPSPGEKETRTSTAAAAGLLDLPGVSGVPIGTFEFSVSTSPSEIQAAIDGKKKKIEKIKRGLKEFRKNAEEELLKDERYKSQKIILGIYSALKDLAMEQGASVVIDKESILYGNKAVDLTDTLLEKLEETDGNQGQ